MDRFLVIVSTKNEIDSHLGESAQDFLRVLEPVALRQLSFDRIMMHHDRARVALRCLLKRILGLTELLAPNVADDRDVANVPGERAPRDPV
jgi:hypothetical protein